MLARAAGHGPLPITHSQARAARSVRTEPGLETLHRAQACLARAVTTIVRSRMTNNHFENASSKCLPAVKEKSKGDKQRGAHTFCRV